MQNKKNWWFLSLRSCVFRYQLLQAMLLDVTCKILEIMSIFDIANSVAVKLLLNSSSLTF